jgi:hypothetical protein
VSAAAGGGQGWGETGTIFFLFLALFIGIRHVSVSLFQRRRGDGTQGAGPEQTLGNGPTPATDRIRRFQLIGVFLCLGLAIVFGIVWLIG